MVEFVCPNCFKRGYIPTLVNEEDMLLRSKMEVLIKEFESNIDAEDDVFIESVKTSKLIMRLKELLEK